MKFHIITFPKILSTCSADTSHLLPYGMWLLEESNPSTPVKYKFIHAYIHSDPRIFNDDTIGIIITLGIPKYVRHVLFVKLNLSHWWYFILRLEIIPPLSRQQSSWCVDEAGVRISPWHTVYPKKFCTRFLLCCALLWLYIDWFSHIHQAYFTGTVAI